MITFHADDYGLSPNVSSEILTLAEQGYLDGISAIVNMQDSMVELSKLVTSSAFGSNQTKICLHLNLMEGHCCANPSDIPLLVDSEGYFSLSWIQLFINSFIPWNRKYYRQQLTVEITAQINRFLAAMPSNYVLRIDSHQHTHVIPLVWDALYDAIVSSSIHCEFVRLPAEPLIPYLRNPSLYCSYGISSWIKNIILNYCSWRSRHHSIVTNSTPFYLWGVMMGCHMDSARLSSLLPSFLPYGKDEQTLCLLFHPGMIKKNEITEQYSNPAFLEVETSDSRHMEQQTLRSLHDAILAAL